MRRLRVAGTVLDKCDLQLVPLQLPLSSHPLVDNQLSYRNLGNIWQFKFTDQLHTVKIETNARILGTIRKPGYFKK